MELVRVYVGDLVLGNTMGNKLTLCDLPYSQSGKQLKTVLTPEQIRMVQGSWDLIKGDLSKLGLVVFVRWVMDSYTRCRQFVIKRNMIAIINAK